jgi:hypothetical protein
MAGVDRVCRADRIPRLAMLPAPDSDPPPTSSGPRRYRRFAAIAVASLLVHLFALDLLPRWSIPSPDDTAGNHPLRMTLMPPVRVEEPPAAAPQSPQPEPTRKSAPRRPLPEFVPDSLEPIPQVRAGLSAPAPVGPATPDVVPAIIPPATPVTADEPVVPVTPTTPAAPSAVAAVAPRSARLSYTVVYVDRKNASPITYNGVGTIDWTIADGQYRSSLLATVPILFMKVDVLATHSEGSVTASGLAPDRYTESPRKRATVSTNFNRDARQSITYSSTTASAPLVPGVQDRLSLLFQIGALLLANAPQAAAGGRIEMPVAGVRGEAETWVFENQGTESIETGSGPLSTTHLRRTPRPGSNDRIIDVWIAQSDGGYPARVMYTEPSDGSTIEMLLEKIGTIE